MTKKKIKIIIYIIGLFPFIFHLTWLTYSDWKFTKIKNGKDFILAEFQQKDAINPSISYIKVIGTYGDIYRPKIKNPEREYNMIVLSATIDPLLYAVGDKAILQTNLLVQKFFEYAYSEDPALVESGFRNLIIRMFKNNREYINFLMSEPIRKITYNTDYVVSLCEPFIARVPENSLLWKEGVRWYAILPLFDSKRMQNEIDKELIQRMSINVQTAVMRLFKDLSKLSDIYGEYRIRTIALPALGGMSGISLNDGIAIAHPVFTYQDSFESIFKGIEKSIIPTSIEKIYFVGWDKAQMHYKNPLEEKAIISSLRNIYETFWFNTHWPIKLLGYSILVIFCIAYLLERLMQIKKSKLKNKHISTSDFILGIFIIMVSLYANFAVIGKYIILLLEQLNVWDKLLVLIVEIVMGFLSVRLGLTLARFKLREIKKLIINE